MVTFDMSIFSVTIGEIYREGGTSFNVYNVGASLAKFPIEN